jgi:polar amino acid transport system substrate-binding protein
MKKIFCFMAILVILSFCGCSKQVKPLPPIESARIGTMLGTVNEPLAKKKYPKADIKVFNNYVDSSEAVLAGKVDYTMMDYSTAKNMAKHNQKLYILPENLSDEMTAMAVSKENKELTQKINDILKKFLKDGTMDEIISHWFSENTTDYKIVEVPKVTDGPVLKIAVSTLMEPRCFVKDGKITGMNVELMDRVAYELGMKTEYQNMDFAAMIDSLQSGKSDVIAAMYETPERAEKVDFTVGYFANPQVIMVRKDRMKAGTITLNDQLNGKRVGFITGMVHIEKFRPKYKAQEYEFSNFPAMLEALKTDKIDAMLTGQGKVAEIVKENPELIALPSYGEGFSSVGINKDNTELADKLDPIIKRIVKDGTLDKLQDKWLGNDEDAKVLSPVTLDGRNGTLVVGELGDDYPYSYYKDNELTGLEIELARLFASKLNRKLEIVTMDFSGIIPSIASGKIDIAFYLSYTEERAKSIKFLSPMKADPCVAIVKNRDFRKNTPKGKLLSAWAASLKDSFTRTFITEDRYKLILQGLWITIVISVLSLLFGSLLGALICAMHRSKPWLLSGIAKVYIRLIQGVPIVLILMILYYILFAKADINPVFIAIAGFSINFSAYSSEIFRTAIDTTDKGQLEAAYALGFSKHRSFLMVTLPQALRHILPIFKGEFISMVKMTSVVGYIAIQDLTKMSDIIRSRTFDAFFPLFVTAFIYFAITGLFILLLGKVETRIDPKRRKRIVKGIRQSENHDTEVRA